jgi:protein TonB
VRPASFAWALGASAAVHATLLVAPLLGGDGASGQRTLRPPPLSVALKAEPERALAAPGDAPSLTVPGPKVRAPVQTAAPRAVQPAAPPRAEPPSQAGVPIGISVPGEPLVAMSRIGDELLQRNWNEFPVEVAWPVRVHDVHARYPAGALHAAREGNVVLWIVVDAEGAVEEMQIAEGDEDFAKAAMDAVGAARFEPAKEDGKPIRYPIALEFRFELPAARGAPEGVAAAK